MASVENCYNGNPKVKRDGVNWNYTEHELKEYIKCKADPVYFICNYVEIIHLDHGQVKFKLRGYQEKMVNHFNDNRMSVVLSGRQSGKTITSAAWLLWYICFHSEKTVAILANKGAIARDILYRITSMLETVPFFLQPGVKELNKGSITFSNKSKIIAAATSSSSIRGMSCVPDYTKVCVLLDDKHVFYTTIEKANIINNNESEFIENHMNIKRVCKYYTVYKITNIVNGKEYIGYHQTDDLDDGYMGSGKLIRKAILKYGPQNFIKEYIKICSSKEEAESLEEFLVDSQYVAREDTYNISTGGNVCILHGEDNGFFNRKHSEETKELIRQKRIGSKVSNVTKQKLSSNLRSRMSQDPSIKERLVTMNIGRVVSKETRMKMSKSQIGKIVSEETGKKISDSKKAAFSAMSPEERELWRVSHFTPERSASVSKALTGKSKTEDHVNKINRNPDKIRKTADKHRGMKRSDDAKLRMSLAKKGRKARNAGMIQIYNITLDESRQIAKDEIVPDGWVRGTRHKYKK